MSIFERIKIFFAGVFRAFKKIIDSIFTTALKKFITEAWDFATKVVKSLENVDLANEKKREEAYSKIKGMAKAEGLYHKNNWINILLELALQAIRKETEF